MNMFKSTPYFSPPTLLIGSKHGKALPQVYVFHNSLNSVLAICVYVTIHWGIENLPMAISSIKNNPHFSTASSSSVWLGPGHCLTNLCWNFCAWSCVGLVPVTAAAMRYDCDDHIMSGSQHFTEVFLTFRFLSFLTLLRYFLSCGESSGGGEGVNIDVLWWLTTPFSQYSKQSCIPPLHWPLQKEASLTRTKEEYRISLRAPKFYVFLSLVFWLGCLIFFKA